MIYHLLYPLSDTVSVFNVFRYITFRSIYALLTALALSILFSPRIIAWMKRVRYEQYIKQDGPKHQGKEGTPTMGGLIIIFSVMLSVLLWGDLSNHYLWLTNFVFIGFGSVGFWDDYTKITRQQNQGISAKSKFLAQLLIAGIAIIVLLYEPAYSTKLAVPFLKSFQPDLGWFYVPLTLFILVGTSNAVNLTDGLDGLAIGPYIIAASCFALFIYVAGHATISEYLKVMPVPGVGEVTVFCGALIGASLGFLWFNAYPAEVFMGDVGSLSLGGALGFLAVLCKQELLLAIVGGVYVFETISVILQVSYFKFSGGKRIFRMAPLHHHFELKGIPESKIIIRFWIISILLALLALSTLKLR